MLAAVKENKIENTTWILPYIPPWEIGGFIRYCDAICFLENNFSVQCHMPFIPTEVLLNRGCLILASEIAEKQPFYAEAIHKKSVLIVNMGDPMSLINSLNYLEESRNICLAIANEGHKLYEKFSHSQEELKVKLKREFENIFSHMRGNYFYDNLLTLDLSLARLKQEIVSIGFEGNSLLQKIYSSAEVKKTFFYVNHKRLKCVFSRLKKIFEYKLLENINLFLERIYPKNYDHEELIFRFKEFLTHKFKNEKIAVAVEFEY